MRDRRYASSVPVVVTAVARTARPASLRLGRLPDAGKVAVPSAGLVSLTPCDARPLLPAAAASRLEVAAVDVAAAVARRASPTPSGPIAQLEVDTGRLPGTGRPPAFALLAKPQVDTARLAPAAPLADVVAATTVLRGPQGPLRQPKVDLLRHLTKNLFLSRLNILSREKITFYWPIYTTKTQQLANIGNLSHIISF